MQSSLVYVSNRRALRKIILSLAAITVLSFAAIALTPLGQPFRWDVDAPRVRRLHLQVWICAFFNVSQNKPLQHTTRRHYANDGSEIENVNMMVIAPQDHRGCVLLSPRESTRHCLRYKDWPTEGVFAEHSAIQCKAEWGKFCNIPYYVPVTDLLPPK